jgi:hypothetical protein
MISCLSNPGQRGIFLSVGFYGPTAETNVLRAIVIRTFGEDNIRLY